MLYPSQMDTSVKLNDETWAVSMVVETPGLHTILIIETVKQGVLVNYKAHLTGPRSGNVPARDLGRPLYCWSKMGVVQMKRLPQQLILTKYRKWDTWSLTRELGVQLICSIQEEQNNGKQIPFHILGGKSIFSSEANFVVEGDPQLEKMRKEQPNEFEKLFDLYEEGLKMEQVGEAFEAKVAPTRQVHALPTKYQCSRAVAKIVQSATKRLDDADKDSNNVAMASAIGYSLVAIPAVLACTAAAIAFDMPRVRYYQRKVEEKKNLLTRIEAHAKRVISQNCFNWSRNKLAAIGVQVQELPCERLAVIPTLYLKSNKK